MKRAILSLALASAILSGLPHGAPTAADPVRTKSFGLTHAQADEVKDRLDKVLRDLGEREGCRIIDGKNALEITASEGALRAMEELIPVIDQPSTQNSRGRRILEISMRISRHYASRKKEYDTAIARGRIPTVQPGAPPPATAAPSALAARPAADDDPDRGLSDQAILARRPAARAKPPAPAPMERLAGIRLHGVLLNGASPLAVLRKDGTAYLLKQGRLYESGLYPVRGVSGVVRSDRVILAAHKRAPLVLKLYDQETP